MYLELHADYFAGYLVGELVKEMNQDNDLLTFYLKQSLYINFIFHSLGDYSFGSPNHHGTPDERYLAYKKGFDLSIKSINSKSSALTADEVNTTALKYLKIKNIPSNPSTNNNKYSTLHISDQFEEKGKEKYDHREYLEAIELFSQSLQINPVNGNSYYLRGLSYLYQGKIQNDEALADLNRALQINGDNTIYFYFGFLHQRQGKWKEAIGDYNKTLNIYPNNVYAYLHRAECKSMINDVSGVMNDYDEIIKREKILPEYFDIATVFNNKAYNLIQVNEFAKALPLVNKALALDKNKGYIWDTRGELFYKLKDYQKCIQDMSRAINLTKTSANSYYYRGLAYFKLNNKSEGCSDLYQAREHGNLESNKVLTENCR